MDVTPVIAIDGPAASGKSSTAAAVARRLGWLHVDSGALYRGVTRVALDLGDTADAARILEAAETRGLDLRVEAARGVVMLDGRPAEDRIRDAAVTAAVSAVSALPAVRAWVTARLRALPAGGRPVVLDGRDIGTAVFPEAPLKVYLTASPPVRARRRLLQQGRDPAEAEVAAEAGRIAARDSFDAGRAVAPLRAAEDAVALDTTGLRFEEQVDRIVALARARGLHGGPRTG
jgi:cytidylate kinase